MKKELKIVIVGDSAFAEVAYEYFTYDSSYEVVAFAVEKQYLTKSLLFGKPVVPFEEITTYYPPETHQMYVAIVYSKLNRLRTRLYLQAKALGYSMASYVSPRAFVWRNVKLGEHNFIFEDNVIQPFVTIGNNIVLWSGNHIGHHSTIKDNCFIASHAVVSGFVEIGENCFVGVNATFANNIIVGSDCIIGAGALVIKNVEADKVVKGSEASGSAKRLVKVE